MNAKSFEYNDISMNIKSLSGSAASKDDSAISPTALGLISESSDNDRQQPITQGAHQQPSALMKNILHFQQKSQEFKQVTMAGSRVSHQAPCNVIETPIWRPNTIMVYQPGESTINTAEFPGKISVNFDNSQIYSSALNTNVNNSKEQTPEKTEKKEPESSKSSKYDYNFLKLVDGSHQRPPSKQEPEIRLQVPPPPLPPKFKPPSGNFKNKQLASTQKLENFQSVKSNESNKSSMSQTNLRFKIEEMRRIQNISPSNILSKTTSADGGTMQINNFSKALSNAESESSSDELDQTNDIIAPSIEESYRESTQQSQRSVQQQEIPETKKSMTIIHEDEKELEISQFQRKDGQKNERLHSIQDLDEVMSSPKYQNQSVQYSPQQNESAPPESIFEEEQSLAQEEYDKIKNSQIYVQTNDTGAQNYYPEDEYSNNYYQTENIGTQNIQEYLLNQQSEQQNIFTQQSERYLMTNTQDHYPIDEQKLSKHSSKQITNSTKSLCETSSKKSQEQLVTLGASFEDLPLQESNKTVIQKIMQKQQEKLHQQETFRPKSESNISEISKSQHIISQKQKEISKIKEVFPGSNDRKSYSGFTLENDSEIGETPPKYVNRSNFINVPPKNSISMLLEQKDSEINLIEQAPCTPSQLNFFTGQENILSEIEIAASQFCGITGFGAQDKSYSNPQIEQYILMAHKVQQQLKEKEIQLQISQQSLQDLKEDHIKDLAQQKSYFQKEKENLLKEIQNQKTLKQDLEKQNRIKMKEIRDKNNQKQKEIFSSVETEYEQVLKVKERQINELKEKNNGLQRKLDEEMGIIKLEAFNDKRNYEIEKAHREDQERRRLEEERAQMIIENKEELHKEMKKLKEILSQEFEYRKNELESSYQSKEDHLRSQIEEERRSFIIQQETQLRTTIDSERTKLADDRLKSTQDIYDDIYRTLKQKFMQDQKQALQDITQKLTASFQEKIRQVEVLKEKELAAERKKLALIELKKAQQENENFNVTQKMQKMESELTKNRTMQATLSNLQPKKGSDGNCKRCEALLIANGLQIEKINKLKKQIKKE